MQFCGKTAKFETGQVVYYNTDNEPELVIIENIGILGGKLSEWRFLYHIRTQSGDTFDVIEETLSGLPPKNENK